MRYAVRLLVAASFLLAACGAPTPTTIEFTGNSGGHVLTVKVDDPASLVESAAISSPVIHFDDDKHKGIGFNKVEGEPKRLLVTWIGGGCSRASVVVAIKPSGSGISITVREPRFECKLDIGEVKAIELQLRSPVQLDAVTGALLQD